MGRGANSAGAGIAVAPRGANAETVTVDQLGSKAYSLLARLASASIPTHMQELDAADQGAAAELEELGLAQTGVEDQQPWVSLNEAGVNTWEGEFGLDEFADIGDGDF